MGTFVHFLQQVVRRWFPKAAVLVAVARMVITMSRLRNWVTTRYASLVAILIASAMKSEEQTLAISQLGSATTASKLLRVDHQVAPPTTVTS